MSVDADEGSLLPRCSALLVAAETIFLASMIASSTLIVILWSNDFIAGAALNARFKHLLPFPPSLNGYLDAIRSPDVRSLLTLVATASMLIGIAILPLVVIQVVRKWRHARYDKPQFLILALLLLPLFIFGGMRPTPTLDKQADVLLIAQMVISICVKIWLIFSFVHVLAANITLGLKRWLKRPSLAT